MKKIISINIGGKVFQINDDAFTKLDAYINHLRKHFRTEEGGDEIMDDMEARMAELLSEKTNNASNPVGVDEVLHVINTIGDPSQFDENTKQNNNSTNSNKTNMEDKYQPRQKKLFRDSDDKVIFGVCSGLGHYFGIDALIIRLAFIIMLFTFGSPILIYIILTILIPKATSYEEKVQMTMK